MTTRRESAVDANEAVNPYAPPVFDAPAAAVDGSHPRVSPYYYVVAPTKFYLLAVTTYGVYAVYWFYAHFRARQRSGGPFGPLLSGVFNFFTVYNLFRGFDQRARDAGLPRQLRAAVYAGPYMALLFTSRLMRILFRGPTGYLLSLGVVLACVYPLAMAQRVANHLAGDEHGQSNARFSAGNVAAIGLGLVFTALNFVAGLELIPPK